MFVFLVGVFLAGGGWRDIMVIMSHYFYTCIIGQKWKQATSLFCFQVSTVAYDKLVRLKNDQTRKEALLLDHYRAIWFSE